MKPRWFVWLLLLSLTRCAVQQDLYLFSYFKNRGEDGLHLAVSRDGMHWQALNGDSALLAPQLGKERLMRDPCILQDENGVFHMVWTVGWNEKGIGYARSTNLTDWSTQRYLPVMEHEPGARNCWAPEISYDPATKLYYIFWATTIEGRFPETDSLAESNYNHRLYYVTTPDFGQFSETRLFYDGGFNVIDGTIIRYGNRYTMFVKNETLRPAPEKNIRVLQATKITGPYSAPSPPVTGNYWAEGPTVIRAQDAWILYFDKYREHHMGALRSPDLETWEDISAQVSFPGGVRHGTAFRAPFRVVKKIPGFQTYQP